MPSPARTGKADRRGCRGNKLPGQSRPEATASASPFPFLASLRNCLPEGHLFPKERSSRPTGGRTLTRRRRRRRPLSPAGTSGPSRPTPAPAASPRPRLSGRGAELAGWPSTLFRKPFTVGHRQGEDGRPPPEPLSVLDAHPFPKPSPRRSPTGRGLGEGSASLRLSAVRGTREGGPSPAAADVGGLSALRALRVLHAPPVPPRLRRALAAARARRGSGLSRDCEIPDG